MALSFEQWLQQNGPFRGDENTSAEQQARDAYDQYYAALVPTLPLEQRRQYYQGLGITDDMVRKSPTMQQQGITSLDQWINARNAGNMSEFGLAEDHWTGKLALGAIAAMTGAGLAGAGAAGAQGAAGGSGVVGSGLSSGGGLGLTSGGGLGLTASTASGAPITNALLSPAITGGATGLASAGAGMGFLDTLFNPSNLMSFAGNIGGALINSNASGKAVDAQLGATNSSNALLKSIYDQNREDLAPWRQTGVNALMSLAKLNTPGNQLNQAQLDPGYAFRQQQGEQAINRSAAARGLLGSGRTIKDLIRFNQDYATNEFGNVNNRLLAMSGLGQTATNTGVAAGQNYAGQAGQNMLGAGNARASGYVGQANAQNNAIGGTLNNYNSNRLLSALIPGYA